jgi:hypothetical protein
MEIESSFPYLPELSTGSYPESITPYPMSQRSVLLFCSHLRLGLLTGLFTSSTPTKFLRSFLLSAMRTTYTAHLILLYLIILIILCEDYKLWSYSLCSFLQCLITSCLFDRNIPSAPSSQTPSVYVPPLMPETNFETNTKPQAKIQFCIIILLSFRPQKKDKRFWTEW